MVKAILSLRYTTTVHQLRREWWRMLVLIGGAIWSLSLFPSIAWASQILSFNAPDVKYDALVAITAIVMLGWVVVPVLITGVDDTLDPGRFATFGVDAKRIMPGLTVSAMLTVPALFFLGAFVVLALSWATERGYAVTYGLVGAVLTAGTLVLSARVTVMWATRLLQSRRSREAMFLAVVIGALLVTPIVYLLVADGLETVLQYDVRALLDGLGGTPIGAPVTAAFEASRDNWPGALGHLAISVGWLILLHWVWRVNVERVLVSPVHRGGGAREREDSVMAAAVRAEIRREGTESSRVRTAVHARTLRYWFTDPRYLANLASVAAFPVLFFMVVYPIFGSPIAVVMAIPILLAGSIGWGRHNDVALDYTALWLDVSAGRRGREIMQGRVLSTLAWGVPLTAAAIIVAITTSGHPELTPAVVGAAVGVLGTSLGIAAVTSVRLPYRAPAPGENPFAAEVGSIGASLLSQVLSSLVSWVVALPVSLPLILALNALRADDGAPVDPVLAWIGLGAGVAVGASVLWLGVRWAGDIYDRRSGRLVGAVR